MSKEPKVPEPGKTPEVEFEQMPMGGDAKVLRKLMDDEMSTPYFDFVHRMRELARSRSTRKNPPVTKETFTDTITKGGKDEYVDAMISARPRLGSGTGSGKDHYSPIYIHTYAVSNLGDSVSRFPIVHPDAAVGYYIQMTMKGDRFYFIARKHNESAAELRARAEQIHDYAVKLTKADPNESVFVISRQMEKKFAPDIFVRDELTRPFSYEKTVHAKDDSSEGDVPTQGGIEVSRFDVMTEFTQEEYRRIFNELYEYSRAELKAGDASLDKEFQGTLLPRRKEHQPPHPSRPVDKPQFLHEYISTAHGGVFLFTRAFSGESGDMLPSTPNDITGYGVYAGFHGDALVLRINSGDPSLVKMIHGQVFSLLQARAEWYAEHPSLFDGEAVKDEVKKILSDTQTNLANFKSDIDNTKPLIEPPTFNMPFIVAPAH